MPYISENELKKQIKNLSFKNFYFLFGQEKYLIKHYTQKLTDSILNHNINDFNLKTFIGESFDLASFEESVETLPFLSPCKCIVVQDLDIEDLHSDELKNFKEIISNLPDQTTVIFSFSTLDFDVKKSSKWRSFLKYLETLADLVELKKMSKSELTSQLITWAQKLNKDLSTKNSQKLIDCCGDNLLDLKNELKKLASFSKNAEISSEDIDFLVTKKLEANVFDLTKAISQKNLKKALKILDFLIDKKEEPIAILSLIANSYIDMYRVKACHNSASNIKEITKYFDYKRKEFRLDIANKASFNLSTDKIKNDIKILIDADLAIKSSNIEKKIILEKTVVKLLQS